MSSSQSPSTRSFWAYENRMTKSIAQRLSQDLPSPRRYLLLAGLVLTLLVFFYHHNYNTQYAGSNISNTSPKARFRPGIPKPLGSNYTQTLVVSRTTNEDISWIERELPNLPTAIYTADDPSAALHPPSNKGHESMIYLTYIIDNYNNLADITIFVHAHQVAWHNNDLFDFDMAKMLRRLSNEHVTREGFFNLRCHPESGCPNHINMLATVEDPWKQEEIRFPRAWSELHGDDPMPKYLGAPCCSQFAVSRERLRSISLERWKRYRDWLLTTELEDSISGRIWEFTWFYILTGETIQCRPMNECYCEGFGVCFGSLERVESWLNLKEIEFLAQDRKDRYEEEGRDTGALDGHLLLRISKPLGQRLEEAILKGDDPRNRAIEAGRPWKEGDGF